MNTNNKDLARLYHELGLLAVPKKKDTPEVKNKYPYVSWEHYTDTKRPTLKEIEFEWNWNNGICIICGKVSNNLEVLDFDNKSKKYRANDVLRSFLDLVFHEKIELAQKLIIILTPSGGYHIPYFSDKIDTSKKLAKDLDNEVLIETRGEGGLIVAHPTVGYTIHHGDTKNPLSDIPFLSVDERDLLIKIAKSFHKKIEVKDEEKTVNETKTDNFNWTGLTPFEDFNNRGDVLDLLEKEGIRKVGQKGNIFIMKRDGTTAAHSGYYFSDTKILFLFSTSTIFEAEKGYNNSQIYALLKHNNDFKATFKDLISQGYGDKQSTQSYTKQANNNNANSLSFLEERYQFYKQKKEEEEKAKLEKEKLYFKKRRNKYKQVDYSQAPTQSDPFLFYQKQSEALLRFGETMIISGKAGSRKTTFLNGVISSILNPNIEVLTFQCIRPFEKRKILRLETEQSKATDYYRTLDIKRNAQTNLDNLISYRITDETPSFLRQFLLSEVEENENELCCVVVDGIIDLIQDANSMSESQTLIQLIKKILAKNIAFIGVMHENEGNASSGKMVGHAGSFLKRKAEINFVIEQSQEHENQSIAKRGKFRNVPRSIYTDMNFTIEDGYYKEVEEIEVF